MFQLPLTFDTAGGPKDTKQTIGLNGANFGEEVVYMLKSCPFVKSLGKMIEKGFLFFWGKDYAPTLAPPNEPVSVQCNPRKCITASRIDHGVPIFTEEVSFVPGTPAVAEDNGVGENIV